MSLTDYLTTLCGYVPYVLRFISLNPVKHKTLYVQVPMPIGGALIGSSSSLIYANQSQRLGVSTNCFASISVESELHHVIPNLPHKIGIALASAKSCFVNEDMALLFLKTGAIYSVHLRRDSRGSNTVVSLYMNRVASSKSAISCVTRLRSTYEKYDEEY